jgi:hypothetical protein
VSQLGDATKFEQHRCALILRLRRIKAALKTADTDTSIAEQQPQNMSPLDNKLADHVYPVINIYVHAYIRGLQEKDEWISHEEKSLLMESKKNK